MATSLSEERRQALIDQIPRDSGSQYQQTNTPVQPNPATSGIHSTELGRNVYNAAMALPGVGGVAKLATTGGMISRAFNAAAGAANTASRGTAALATVPNAVPEAKAQAMDGAQPAQQQLGPSPNAPAATPQTQSLANAEEMQRRQAVQPTGQQVSGLSGVYKHGHGQYSDNPNGMGLPQNLGQPSAQNMAAANNLASQQQTQSTARVQTAAQQAVPQAHSLPSFQMPRQENAYEREARMRERNSIMSRLQQPMTGDPRRDLTASQRQQMVAMLGQEQEGRLATERNLVDLARQQMSDQTQRYTTDAHAGVGQQRNLIDAARLGVDQQTQGFANRAAAQQEQLRNTLLDERATPEQRSSAQRSLAALAGRTATENLSNNYMRRKVPMLSEQGLPTGETREEIIDLRSGRPLEAPSIPPGAIADLRRNPQLAAQFDETFGQGASSQYLR